MPSSRILQKSFCLTRDVKRHGSCLSVFRDMAIYSRTTISFNCARETHIASFIIALIAMFISKLAIDSSASVGLIFDTIDNCCFFVLPIVSYRLSKAFNKRENSWSNLTWSLSRAIWDWNTLFCQVFKTQCSLFSTISVKLDLKSTWWLAHSSWPNFNQCLANFRLSLHRCWGQFAVINCSSGKICEVLCKGAAYNEKFVFCGFAKVQYKLNWFTSEGFQCVVFISLFIPLPPTRNSHSFLHWKYNSDILQIRKHMFTVTHLIFKITLEQRKFNSVKMLVLIFKTRISLF